MRTQEWYHDLCEQESSDEIHQMVDDRPRPAAQRLAAPRRGDMQARVPF